MKTLLIVDDEIPFVLSLKDGFSSYSEELNVVVAFNGYEALDYLRTHPVDLLLMDLKMPEMDGYQLVTRMHENGIDVPLVIMSAYGTTAREEWAKSINALDFLEKPLGFFQLLSLIEKHLGIG